MSAPDISTAGMAEGGSDLLRSERIAGGILPKVLNSFDMVAIFVAIVLFISNSAVVAGGAGPSAYIYWVLGFLTFLIPGAIVTGQLGLMFPGEGSIYVWTHKAFGPFMGVLRWFLLLVAGYSRDDRNRRCGGFAFAADRCQLAV